MLDGVSTVAYTDDLAVLVIARNEEELMHKANHSRNKLLVGKIESLVLQKSEAVVLTAEQISSVKFKCVVCRFGFLYNKNTYHKIPQQNF